MTAALKMKVDAIANPALPWGRQRDCGAKQLKLGHPRLEPIHQFVLSHASSHDFHNHVVNPVTWVDIQIVAAVQTQDLGTQPSRTLVAIIEPVRRCNPVKERRRLFVNRTVIPVIRSADCTKDVVEVGNAA